MTYVSKTISSTEMLYLCSDQSQMIQNDKLQKLMDIIIKRYSLSTWIIFTISVKNIDYSVEIYYLMNILKHTSSI